MTKAQQISSLFNDDGQCFETVEGLTLEQACVEAGALCGYRDGFSTFPVKYWFGDDSTIIAYADGWDLGYTGVVDGCFCWQSCGHNDDCIETVE